MRPIVLSLALLISTAAAAAPLEPVLIPPEVLESFAAERAGDRSLPKFGVQVDAGVPDGLGASLLFRPLGWLRLHGGAMTNGFAPGVRGGLTLAPWQAVVTPTLTLEGAHYFAGNANGLARLAAGPEFHSPLLEEIAYRFTSLQLGLELGSQESVAFFLRAGLSYLRSTVPGVEQLLQQSAGSQITAMPLRLEGLLPSLKLGLQVCFG